MSRARLALGALLPLAFLAQGCRSLEDKRVFQYLNRSGFGQRYQGNAAEENFAAVGDRILVSDPVNREYLDLPPQAIDIDGTIDMPEIGSVHVAGLTEGEIAGLLTQLYRPYFEDLRIRVRIQTLAKSFFVVGEVGREGPLPFTRDITIFEAALQAGPNRVTANLSRVRLIRGDPVDPLIVVVDLERLLRTGDTTYNIRLRENDIVIVPPTLIGAIGNALSQLVYPVTQVVSSVLGVLNAAAVFQYQRTFIF